MARVARDHGRLVRGEWYEMADDIEQFDQRHDERQLLVVGEIGAIARDHEPLARRQQRIEEQLTAFVARVTFTDARVQPEDVVAIEGATAQRPFIETEQADHTRRHPVLGHHRTDRHRTAAQR